MKQIHIGICDDDRSDLERIANVVGAVLPEFLPDSIQYEISTYTTGEALLKGCREKLFSLVFTDIEMCGENGMEVAACLEEFSPETGIVFVSNYQNYIFDAQEFEPLWFVRKDKLEKDIKCAIKKYLKKNSYKWVNFKMDDGFGKTNILLDTICYFEGNGHEIKAAAATGEYRMYGSLNKIADELAIYGFIRTHRNYIVNVRQISHIQGNNLELPGDLHLPLGRSYKKDVLEGMKKNVWRKQ